MDDICLYPIGVSAGCRAAAERLGRAGVRVVDHPSPEVSHLLLDVPAFGADGRLRGGGDLEPILEMLPEDLCVIGGKLDALSGYETMDLLTDEAYLAQNAAITADCALRLAGPLLHSTFRRTPVLILGWGRIGKCLGQMLKALGAEVTVAARNKSDRALLNALGYSAVAFFQVPELLPKIGLLFNTVPAKVLDADTSGCVKIDLASVAGLWGEDIIYARGLPGIHAPQATGALIADTILKNWKEERI